MRAGLDVARVVGIAAGMVGGLAVGGLPVTTAAAAAAPSQAPATRFAGTWGACGSWWSETQTRTESGSVCGVDGLVSENGQTTQLAEPLISVTRYVCSTRRTHQCTDETWTGAVRRSEMAVDPLLRRASIRGTLGGCFLDVEFAGRAPAQPQGGMWENHGFNGARPTVGIGANHTFTSQASWWGSVCGQTIVPRTDQEGQGWMFRSAEATIGGFGDHGSGEGDGAASGSRPGAASLFR